MTIQIQGYDWAQNRSKLERAINELKEQGKEVSEENVYKVYTRIAGFVVGEVSFLKKDDKNETKEAEKEAEKEAKKKAKEAEKAKK